MELNPQHVINSLTNQIAEMSAQTAYRVAELNAVIASQSEELEQLRSLRDKEIEEMDKDAE